MRDAEPFNYFMILDIITTDNDPNDVLRTPCKDAEPSADTSMLLHSMIETLRALPPELHAAGLAAPQVGVAIRAFVMGTEKQGYLAFLNPRIVARSGIKVRRVEGCLSQPRKQVQKSRPASITVRGFDAEGNPNEFTAKDMAAAIICHEIDHLNGKLI